MTAQYPWAKDGNRFSQAVESIRGREPMIEENIRKAYDALGNGKEVRVDNEPKAGAKPEKKVKAESGRKADKK